MIFLYVSWGKHFIHSVSFELDENLTVKYTLLLIPATKPTHSSGTVVIQIQISLNQGPKPQIKEAI
jgi:hypothetical protein